MRFWNKKKHMTEHTRTIKDMLKSLVQIRAKKELSSNPQMGSFLGAKLKQNLILNSRVYTMQALIVKFVTKLKVVLICSFTIHFTRYIC